MPRQEVTLQPPAIAGALAALTAASISALIALLAIFGSWLLAAHGDESTLQVIRASGVAWLGAHVVPVNIGTTTLSVLPWGLLLIPSVTLWRASHRALQSATLKSARDYWLVALSISFIYMVVGTVISLISSTNDLGTSWWHSALNLGVVALLVSTACVITYAPTAEAVWGNVPHTFVSSIKPAIIGFATLILIGAIAVVASLGMHFTEVRALTGVMAPNSLDAFFLTALGVGYLPTAVTWASAYVLGPGIHLGGTGVVTLQLSDPGSLPAFPLLALLPSEAPTWAHYVIAVPVIVGIVVYLAAPRTHWKPTGNTFGAAVASIIRIPELITFGSSVVLTSVLMWLVSVVSSGALGVRLLDFVGPDPLDVATATLFLLGAGGLGFVLIPRLLLAMLYGWRVSRRPKPPAMNTVSTEYTPE